MARKKNYFNFNDFNFVDGAVDLFENTIRSAFEFDAFTDDVFEARVLTTPTPIVNEVAVFATMDPLKSKKFSFRVRILGHLSPHRFLEDPCKMADGTTTVSQDQIFSVIQSHTQVFFYDDGTQTRPKIDDVVKIKLARSGHSFDTKRAKQYLGIVQDAPESSTGTSTAPDCSKLETLFKDFDFDEIASSSDGERSWDGKYPAIDGPEVQRIFDLWVSKGGDESTLTKCGGIGSYAVAPCKTEVVDGRSITLHPVFFDKAKKAMEEARKHNSGEIITMGSSRRSIKEQIQLRLGNQIGTLTDEEIITASSKKFIPETAPLPIGSGTGSRHLYGLAIDFGGVLQTGGGKAARLPNSAARNSETFKWMKANVHKGEFLNTSAEPWHWSADGR